MGTEMKFCVIRHPDLETLGTSAESALPHHQARGWFRVSQWRDEGTDFHMPDFAGAYDDLDAAPAGETEPEALPEAAAQPEEQPTPEDKPEPATAARKKENKA